MSDHLVVRLVVAAFVASIVVRYWHARRKAEAAAGTSPVRGGRTVDEARNAVSRLIISRRLRAAVNVAGRRPTYRPADAHSEPTARRSRAGRPRRPVPLRGRPVAGKAFQRSAPRLRPVP